MNNSSAPKAFLFRRTRASQRSLGEVLEPLRFAEPENVDRTDWDRAFRGTQRKELIPGRISVA